jgi:hypothetical protein
MKRHDDMQTVLMRDPVFSKRILLVGRVMLIVFLIVGLAFFVVVCLAIGGSAEVGSQDGTTSSLASRIYCGVFVLLWNLIVIALLRLNSAALGNVKRERIAQ